MELARAVKAERARQLRDFDRELRRRVAEHEAARAVETDAAQLADEMADISLVAGSRGGRSSAPPEPSPARSLIRAKAQGVERASRAPRLRRALRLPRRRDSARTSDDNAARGRPPRRSSVKTPWTRRRARERRTTGENARRRARARQGGARDAPARRRGSDSAGLSTSERRKGADEVPMGVPMRVARTGKPREPPRSARAAARPRGSRAREARESIAAREIDGGSPRAGDTSARAKTRRVTSAVRVPARGDDAAVRPGSCVPVRAQLPGRRRRDACQGALSQMLAAPSLVAPPRGRGVPHRDERRPASSTIEGNRHAGGDGFAFSTTSPRARMDFNVVQYVPRCRFARLCSVGASRHRIALEDGGSRRLERFVELARVASARLREPRFPPPPPPHARRRRQPRRPP